MHKAVAVFTGKSVSRILRDGGTSEWVLDPNRAAGADYVVCTRSGVDWREGEEPQGSAFLIGKVSGVVSSDTPGRYLIKFSEYALIEISDVWKGWRNPVRYATLEDLGIDPGQINFQPMPASTGAGNECRSGLLGESDGEARPLTIEQAKAGLGAAFGVVPSQIEIIIRG